MIDQLGYEFVEPSLLRLALTHRSFCAETDETESNERLEFLGDAVLGLAVTDYIHANYPDLPEGQLAKLRASVVNTATLAEVSGRIGIGPKLLLGKGEDQSGGREKESILADALEAVLGAVFLDAGWERARVLILELLLEDITLGAERPGRQDYKTRLQEMAAERNFGAPAYQISGTGPDHDRRFDAIAMIDSVAYGAGSGTSKKRAEQAAAHAAWLALTSDDGLLSESPSSQREEEGVGHGST